MSESCSGDCPCGAGVARRAFLAQGALGTIGALFATACGDRVIGGTFPTDPLPTKPITIKPSAFPELAAVGGMVKVDGDNGMPVAVVRTGDSTFDALSLVCPHQGAIVEITGSPSFRCPSHLAEFAADGTWIGGKQTADLTRMGVTYDPKGDTLTIDGIASPAPQPIMVVSPTTEVFSAVKGGAAPAAQAIAIANGGGGTLSGLAAVVGYAPGQPAGWLLAALDATTAPATLSLQPNTSSLPAGAYLATVQITAPKAPNAPVSVSVGVVVTDAPAQKPPVIAIASATAAFTGVAGGANPAAQQIAITNTGAGTLAGLSVGTIAYGAGASGWLSATLTGANAPASLVLTPTLGALKAGTYTATVPVIATGASNSPQQVSVTLTVSSATAPPVLSLSGTAVAFNAPQGSIAGPQTVTVQNAGGGSLTGITLGTIAYGSGASGWLNATLASTTAPAVLTITPASASMAPGTYTATIPVIASGVSGSPQNVTVTITIAPSVVVTMSVSPGSVSFSAAAGSSPGGQNVNISGTNGTVSGLAYTIAYGAGATGWLGGSSLSGTSTPAVLTLRAASSSLAAGTYTATVTVTGAGVGSQTVSVTLSVTAAGLAVLLANWPSLASVGGIAGSVGTVQGTPTAVVRTGANSFAAYSMRCPHQGSTINIENWKNTGSAFHCPNHDALFDANGVLLPSSPQKTSNLVARSVSYTPGATTLYIT